MEFVTILVRWGAEPSAHINLVHDDLQAITKIKWCVSRWTQKKDDDTPMNLTLITFRAQKTQFKSLSHSMMQTIMNLWAQKESESMDPLLLEDVMRGTHFEHTKYAIGREDISPHVSFYKHIQTWVKGLKDRKWVLNPLTTIADSDTLFKLHCHHVSYPKIPIQLFVIGFFVMYCYVSYSKKHIILTCLCVITGPSQCESDA